MNFLEFWKTQGFFGILKNSKKTLGFFGMLGENLEKPKVFLEFIMNFQKYLGF